VGAQIIRAMDWPDKDIIADQVEKALPPELRTQNKDQQDDPAQLKQVLQQAMGQIQQLTSALQESSNAAEIEQRKQEWETLRTQITQETALAIAQLKTGSDEAKFINEKMFTRLEQMFMELQAQTIGSPSSSAPASAAGNPPAAAPQIPPSGANTPPGVGIGQ